MWQDASALYGVNNVYVLFADGTDPGLDRTNAANMQVNSDWSPITNAGGHILAATPENLQTVMSIIQEQMTPFTSFYFWSFDHGDLLNPAVGNNDVGLVPWDPNHTGVLISDQELANEVNLFPNAKAELFAFAQCYSGGMPDELFAGPNLPPRFAAWASGKDECSLGQGWADAWAKGLESGLRTSTELGQYARVNDPFGPNGTMQEAADYMGSDFNILTNDLVPEPSSLVCASCGLLLLMLRARTRARKPGNRA
jgi:hypothetical protein